VALYSRKKLNMVSLISGDLDEHGCCRHLIGRGVLGLCKRCTSDVDYLRRIGEEAANRRKADDIYVRVPARRYHEMFMMLSRLHREERNKPSGPGNNSYAYSQMLDELIVAAGRGTRGEVA